MDRVVSHVRRVSLASVALLSVAVGVGTIWVVASPDVIGKVPTWILFGIVGLMILPLAVVGALIMDRRAIASGRPRVGCAPWDSSVAEPCPTGEARFTALGAAMAVGRMDEAARGISHSGSAAHYSDALRHRHQRSSMASQE